MVSDCKKFHLRQALEQLNKHAGWNVKPFLQDVEDGIPIAWRLERVASAIWHRADTSVFHQQLYDLTLETLQDAYALENPVPVANPELVLVGG